jgi:hypothetical protein
VRHLAGSAIPVPAVVKVAFNLVQDGVNPGSSRICVVLLHGLMSSIPLARQGEINGLEELTLHKESAGFEHHKEGYHVQKGGQSLLKNGMTCALSG